VVLVGGDGDASVFFSAVLILTCAPVVLVQPLAPSSKLGFTMRVVMSVASSLDETVCAAACRPTVVSATTVAR